MKKAFISYSWEDEEHKNWVRSFADRLLENGIEATLDQYDLEPGDRLPHFMEQAVTNSDYVLIICTPTYKEKSDARKGGVGYEEHIITAELLSKGNERKFIPVIRKGNVSNALPVSLAGKLAIDLKDGAFYDRNFDDLVAKLKGVSKKPPVNKAAIVNNPVPEKKASKADEPIHILGIITDEVTEPRNDGTRGSALYKVPFRLSKKPSYLWQQLFVQAWNMPPKFSSMHRFGIASVYGDKIVLDGTTIEEVRDHHKETLLLCVEVANQREKEILEAERRKKEAAEARRKNHHDNVNNIASTIEF